MTAKDHRPRTILDAKIDLKPGCEWHSPPLNFQGGDRVTVTATSYQRFYIGLYTTEDYVVKFTPGQPFSFIPPFKWSVKTILKKVRKSGESRLVIRAGTSGPDVSTHLTATILGQEGDGASMAPVDAGRGAYYGPINAWDAIESLALVVVLSVLIGIALYINLAIWLQEGPELRVGGALAVSLFQADAEWGLLLVGLYVAVKQLPDWIRKSRLIGTG